MVDRPRGKTISHKIVNVKKKLKTIKRDFGKIREVKFISKILKNISITRQKPILNISIKATLLYI